MFLDLVMDIFENILNAYSYCEPVSCRGITTCASGSLYLEVQELFWAAHQRYSVFQDFQVFFQHSDPSVLPHAVFVLLLSSSLPWEI